MSREMTEEKRQRLLAQLERGRKTRAANLAKKKKELEEVKNKTVKKQEQVEEKAEESKNEEEKPTDSKEFKMREKKYECPCGKKYTTGTALRTHQRACLYFHKLNAEDAEVEEEMRKIAKERLAAKKKKQYQTLKKELSDEENSDLDLPAEPDDPEPDELVPDEPVKLQKAMKKKKNVIIKAESPVAKLSPKQPEALREIPPPNNPTQSNIVPSAKPRHPPRYTMEEFQTMAQQRQENERRRAEADAHTKHTNRLRMIANNMSAGGLMC